MTKEKQAPYYKVAITRYPPLSTDDELALFAEYRKRRTAKRREKLARQYLYWAAELACRYCGPRMSKAEAISAANYGLMQAIEKFDPAEGKRFVTYSYFAIRREVLYALRDSYVVNPESGLWASKYQYDVSSRTPEDKQRHEVERRAVFDNVSAPSSIEPTSEDRFVEEDCRGVVERDSLLTAMRAALPGLPKELRDVIELKYFTLKGATFVELGEKLGCSKDLARWRHARALQLLQKALRPVAKEL
jgi:RNA polymerase sigma factor (sigma-70 family)